MKRKARLQASGDVLATRAHAKVNLTLGVAGRRADGYHELDSLVVFAGVADILSLEPGEPLALCVAGETAAAAGPDADNLVMRAARHLQALVPGLRMGRFRLVKQIPVAAGLGGGSADAAAALRLLARLNGIAPDDRRLFQAALASGADVPVCLASQARVMAGLGEVLGPPLALRPLFAVLVNPRVATPTPAVFRQLGARPLPENYPGANLAPDVQDAQALRRHILNGANDLERPSCALRPEAGAALAMIAATPGNWLARMSGSGATVFGLYDDRRSAVAAAHSLRVLQPGWWVRSTMLGARRG